MTEPLDPHLYLARNQWSIRKAVESALDSIIQSNQKETGRIWIMLSVCSPKLGDLAISYIGHFVYEDPGKYADIARFLWINWDGRVFLPEDEKYFEHLSEGGRERVDASILTAVRAA